MRLLWILVTLLLLCPSGGWKSPANSDAQYKEFSDRLTTKTITMKDWISRQSMKTFFTGLTTATYRTMKRSGTEDLMTAIYRPMKRSGTKGLKTAIDWLMKISDAKDLTSVTFLLKEKFDTKDLTTLLLFRRTLKAWVESWARSRPRSLPSATEIRNWKQNWVSAVLLLVCIFCSSKSVLLVDLWVNFFFVYYLFNHLFNQSVVHREQCVVFFLLFRYSVVHYLLGFGISRYFRK